LLIENQISFESCLLVENVPALVGARSRLADGLQEPGIATTDVRYGSLADMADALLKVRFAPESRHHRKPLSCPLCAITGLMRRSKTRPATPSTD
jgi:hypothetical protein